MNRVSKMKLNSKYKGQKKFLCTRAFDLVLHNFRFVFSVYSNILSTIDFDEQLQSSVLFGYSKLSALKPGYYRPLRHQRSLGKMEF